MSIFDAEKLLAPIREDAPCGAPAESDDIDLLNLMSEMRQMGETARKIERARSELELMPPEIRDAIIADSAGRSNDPKADPRWRDIASLASEILEKYSKDTRAVAWLLESSVRGYGLPGLAEGLEIVVRLLETYPDQLHPQESDTPSNAIRFIYLLATSDVFLDSIRRAQVSDAIRVSFDSKRLANHAERVSDDDRTALLETGMLTNDAIEKILHDDTNQEDVAAFLDTLELCSDRAARLSTLLSEQSGGEGYSVSALRELLRDIQQWFQAMTPERSDASQTPEENEDPEETSVASSDPGSVTVSKPGGIKTRDDALKALLQVASFFRKSEPHSPLSYALEQAVRWGRMPLPNLLDDLITDKQILSQVYQRMGILEERDGD